MFLCTIKVTTQALSMKCRGFSRLAPLAASIVILISCSVGSSEQKKNVIPEIGQIAVQKRTSDAVTLRADDALAGTAWRLVQIMSMDDRVYVPDDGSRYTLEFYADGSMHVQADCSYGKGSWASKSAGHILFGQIATTRALCPPGSLDDRYMAQFPWVRSYIIKDGRLFLATMADGSIIEFEPMLAK